MWTPQGWSDRSDVNEYGGTRYDIQIPRIGCSGVSKPDGKILRAK